MFYEDESTAKNTFRKKDSPLKRGVYTEANGKV